ncbi:hypothetical protein [Saccharopolyspora gregorii]|uniref:Uncharacterized protein n=1 Tax=Saccharopolyspora gregorii TaxID=33914 RepID=A0ABP6RXX5_9PSEU
MQSFAAKEGWSALRARWADLLPEADLTVLDETVAFAELWHGDQARPAGEPYVESICWK